LSQPNFTVNTNREVTAIYAGDLKGNVWRFDVDSEDPSTWAVAFGGTPLFTAGSKQPITVMPELTFHPSGGVVVSFGTGKMFETEDTSTSTATNVNLNTQAVYGIWDKPGETKGLTDTSLLVEHKDDTTLAAALDTTLKGTQSSTLDPSKRGWFINLLGSGERVTVNPQQGGNVLFVVANTPKVDPCSGGGTSRIFALDPVTGNAPKFGVFDADNSGTITESDKGYNVWTISGGVLSLPLLQRKTGTGGVVTESKYSRGQTGARLGGVEPRASNMTDCDANLLVGVSDTSGKNRDVSLCKKGNDRVSWAPAALRRRSEAPITPKKRRPMKHPIARGGFTLVEAMIVVAIISILAAVAYPSYAQHVARGKRADAKAALLEMAQWMERQYTVNSNYNAQSDGTAITATQLPVKQSPRSGAAAYNISFAAGQPTASTFVLRAVPAGSMSGDACGTLTLDNTGARGSAGTTANCWDR
jgi:prepilin-type N-terminal cleavage/methylation domain-containing protein